VYEGTMYSIEKIELIYTAHGSRVQEPQLELIIEAVKMAPEDEEERLLDEYFTTIKLTYFQPRGIGISVNSIDPEEYEWSLDCIREVLDNCMTLGGVDSFIYGNTPQQSQVPRREFQELVRRFNETDEGVSE
jgi:hypothetical protein